jgi:acetyl-CoA carboxylase biotin carboxylase subunit
LYALECRINAEESSKRLRPSPGKLLICTYLVVRQVRIDSHVYAGYTIPPNYDSMIAKVIVSGQSVKVLLRMKRALQEFVIDGIKTTIPFHIKLMDDERFKSGQFTTAFMENFDLKSL